MILFLSCRESARLLSEDGGRPFSRAERWALRLHLVLCRRCRRFRRALRVLRALTNRLTDHCLANGGRPSLLSAEQRARILTAVRRAPSQ